VFPGGKGEGHYVGLQKAWVRIRTAAGLGDVHLHDLRHTVGAVAASAGASLVVVGRMLGHRKARSTERYAHVAPDAAADAADQAAASIATAIAGRAGRR
jgi:integrase